ncbi:Zn-ribbon domain-containing OB-fold protein [Sneathiella chinensis]|uniref:DNA-binding protein n=1 Tax=Sneathiella chinensis TaxID=349750 RepID=A0ABQ5U4Z1_9PROT|nr:Zn-ribbon domain-containing OB-fold protein [Sneathiella chinensis]GLQ06354.1 DNA-binding protein [Sneathiella chinensis]
MSQQERTYIDPDVNMENQAYWEAAKENRLVLKRCTSCGKTHFYPRSICPHCWSTETEWYEASGKGTIYTYSVMRRAEVPYVIAYVTLEEGITMMTNLVDCDFDALRVGEPVEVQFRQTEGGWALPVFRPVAAA